VKRKPKDPHTQQLFDRLMQALELLRKAESLHKQAGSTSTTSQTPSNQKEQ
jgi:hypothetical protein